MDRDREAGRDLDDASGRPMRTSRARGRRFRFALVVYALGLLAASVATPPSGSLAPLGPFGLVGIDKWLHVGAYAGLSAGVGYAIHAERARTLAITASLAIAFGAGIEVVQALLPARAFTGADALANAVGALVGVVCRWLWLRVDHAAA